ncbi:MAG: DNA alkylation repair protein [Anaerolineae bacterium]|jgi:hypothetical protein
MDAKTADTLGAQLVARLHEGRPGEAHALLAPVLARRTPFRYLDRIARALTGLPWPALDPFLDRLAAGATEGGWVIVGRALGGQLARDLDGALARCRTHIVAAGVWYGADILGERVPGPALVAHFDRALPPLAPWRADDDRWVRRAVGVAVHFWAKRARGAPDLAGPAAALLDFLDPMFEEWEIDAAKGVGWGLKTLGRHYPGLLAPWLEEQVAGRQRRHRAILLRKAATYLPQAQRARLLR